MTNRKRKSTSAPQYEENPAWLTGQPEKGKIRPPVETRADRLPFLESGWIDFERLCRRLADASNHVEKAWAYGKPGQKQYGIDILVRTKVGTYEVWQTKRYEKVQPSDIRQAIDLFLKHAWAEKAKRLVLAFACSLESTTVVEAIEEARERLALKGVEFEPLDAIGLTEKLIINPMIIDVFFGREWVKKVCPPEAIRALEESLLKHYSIASGTQADIPAGVEVIGSVYGALSSQTKKLDALSEQQAKLATKDDLVALARAVEKDTSDRSVRLPQALADRLLREEFVKALKRRGFQRSDTARELAGLASRAVEGDLALGSSVLRADICERAARANAAPETRDLAMQCRNWAAELDPSRDLFVVDAFLKEAAGDADAALRDLKTRPDVDTRSALFSVLIRRRGTEAALEWAKAESLRAADLSPPSALNLVRKTIENGEFETALTFILEIPQKYFEEITAFYLLRAHLRLASILPVDQKSTLFEGLPINPRQLDLASGQGATETAKAALSDLQSLFAQLDSLGLAYLYDFIDEFMLWLRLEIADQRAGARALLAREIVDPKTTLRRVRLALAYDVPFDVEALARTLATRKQLGGWTSAERFAALLIALHTDDASIISRFFAEHHDDLFAQSELAPGYLAVIEINALARAGRIDDARKELSRHSGTHLSEEQAKDAEGRLAAIEKDDEIEQHRCRYDQSGNLTELRLLVHGLRARHDAILLARYAPPLARATRRREDFETAIKALYSARQDRDLLELMNELSELAILDIEFEAIKGWVLYRQGRVTEARAIARKLLDARNKTSDRELAINTAAEVGDWGDLQRIVAQENERIDTLSAHDAMRLARLAFECSSPYFDRFRDSALSKAPGDPEIYLSAYMLAIDCGEEHHGTQAQEWFAKAVELSGSNGPVKALSLRDLVDHVSGVRGRFDQFDKALRRADMPMFAVARALRQCLLDLTLGQARSNLDCHGRRLKAPIFAFSGAKPVERLESKSIVALDITALITLHHLGYLEKALAFFDHIVIVPQTLSYLFAERQFIRVQQPTEVTKARRIITLISSGHLRIVPRSTDPLDTSASEIGADLVTLLAAAKANGGLVLRSAPILKQGSYLEEAADTSAYSSQLTDTLTVLSFLAEHGKIETSKRRSAEHFLSRVDKGWGAASSIEATTPLYLDDLTVSYLYHVELLESLTHSVKTVFVHQDVQERASRTLQHAEHAGELLDAIEHIRSALESAVARGRARFSGRYLRHNEEGNEDELSSAPTLDLLYDLTGVSVVVVDDRYLNKNPHWTDAAGHIAHSGTSLDVLATLRSADCISKDECWRARHTLRNTGFYAVPLDIDELLYHLGNASVRNDIVIETPELIAVRENLNLPLINDAFLTSENHWLVSIRLAVSRAMRQIWIDVSNESLARARANWLLSILPEPMEWCREPESDAAWAAARQQTAMQATSLMIFAEGSQTQRHRYFHWLEGNFLTPLRERCPQIWDEAITFLKFYVKKLWEVELDSNSAFREVLAQFLINPLPEAARVGILRDEAFCGKLGITPQFCYPLDDDTSVETVSLHNALRAAMSGRKTARLVLKSGKHIHVKLGVQNEGTATLLYRKRGFAFLNADLLSAQQQMRLLGFRRVMGAQPLTAFDERKWRNIAEVRSFTDREYDELMTALDATPEAVRTKLMKPQELAFDSFMPDSPDYYSNILARLESSSNLESFITNELASTRASLLARHPDRAVRRIAYSALWQPLVPLDLLADIDVSALSQLHDAEDPFSLLFGFEVCRAQLEKDAAFADVGKAFLEKLFADPAQCESRCEIFSACALIASNGLRRSARASTAPVFWARLAALTHAGVATDALGKIPDPKGFLHWASRNFVPDYIWNGIVDRREAPRWKPEWITPGYLFAELVGRARNCLHMLVEDKRPSSWVATIDEAAARLVETGNILASVFPGPFDDFQKNQPELPEVFKEIEQRLETATHIEQVPGAIVMACATQPSPETVAHFLRILKLRSERPASDVETELQYLKADAHVAVVARSAPMAEAIIDRCLGLVRNTAGRELVTDIFAVMAEACAAYTEGASYHKALGDCATRVCFALDDEVGCIRKLLAALDVLTQRDERLAPAFARAHTIARTKFSSS